MIPNETHNDLALNCGLQCSSVSHTTQSQKAGLPDQTADFFQNVFTTSYWPARWNCGTWSDFHGWLYIISDLMIWAAYFAIPVLLIRVVSKRKDLPFSNIFWLFGAFIILCGMTHFFDAAMFWWPAYRLNAIIRMATAVISVFTVFSLYKVLPQIFSLRTVQELEHEIRERKLVEKKLAASEFLLSEAGRIGLVGGWELSMETKQPVWSRTVYEIYELPYDYPIKTDEAIGYFLDPYKNIMENAIELTLQTGKGWDLELQMKTAKKKIKWVRSFGEPLFDESGKLTQIHGVFMDIDRYKTNELALKQSISDLVRSNENLQQFAYVASHDLQEPLRKIRYFSDLLVERYAAQLGEGVKYLQRIQLSSNRMSILIHDLLAYAAISTSMNSTSQVNLQDVLDAVLMDLDLLIHEIGAQVFTESLPHISGDKTQLGQLFQNLLNNALKFRKTGTPAVIHITCKTFSAQELPDFIKPLRESPQYYCIDVRDNGIGFDQKYADRIFQVFQRLHSKSEFSGTGIGLAICEKVVANHGGAIMANSSPGQGATFSIFFPLDYGRLPEPIWTNK